MNEKTSPVSKRIKREGQKPPRGVLPFHTALNRKRPLLTSVLSLGLLLLLLFTWLKRANPDAPFSIAFISTTGSVPGSGHHGRHGIFAVTNCSNFAVILPEFSMWSYKDGNQSRAWQEYFGTNGMRILQPKEGCL